MFCSWLLLKVKLCSIHISRFGKSVKTELVLVGLIHGYESSDSTRVVTIRKTKTTFIPVIISKQNDIQRLFYSAVFCPLIGSK